MEADLMAALAHRLMVHGLSPDQMALISPHRAQNNAIIKRLGDEIPEDIPLPLVDTIERVQGAERDVIIFGITSSDPDHLLSEFLNSPNRLNVAMTRAKTKLIIIGSKAFFLLYLIRNPCWKKIAVLSNYGPIAKNKMLFSIFRQKKSKQLDIEGFRSLRKISCLPGDLNVIIGLNSTGKSNLLHFMA